MKYFCVISEDRENWIIGTLEDIQDWLIKEWDINTKFELAEMKTGILKTHKISTDINLNFNKK